MINICLTIEVYKVFSHLSSCDPPQVLLRKSYSCLDMQFKLKALKQLTHSLMSLSWPGAEPRYHPDLEIAKHRTHASTAMLDQMLCKITSCKFLLCFSPQNRFD